MIQSTKPDEPISSLSAHECRILAHRIALRGRNSTSLSGRSGHRVAGGTGSIGRE